jgi:sorting nexin-8
VPKSAEQSICERFVLFTSRIAQRVDSDRADTTKLLLELQDGHKIETVVMKHRNRATVCISSQIGCKMGCKFCATGTLGIIGNLTMGERAACAQGGQVYTDQFRNVLVLTSVCCPAGEIVEQLVYAMRVSKVRNVVFMGMGEPLNNYDNVKSAIDAMTDVKRFSLSGSHITISTVGVIPKMYKMTYEMPHVNLALSLHAPNQDLRCQIVPTATAYPLDKVCETVER